MYSTQKPFRDENYKLIKKSHKNTPSFSSTLLDEIYRSIDGNDDVGPTGDEETAMFERACLVDEWMKKEKAVTKTRKPSLLPELDNTSFQDNDFMFFSSNSSSSDSSGALSSSDTEFFGSCRTKTSRTSKVSCFSTKPKPVRTGARYDDCSKKNAGIVDDDLGTNKSRALNFYENLKKVKQPISPGAKLTSFINSIFSSSYKSKKGKKSRPNGLDNTNKGFDRDSKTTSLSSSCSSASSFSRSCLIKNSSSKSRDGIQVQRTVRFHLGEEEDCGRRYSTKPPLPPNAKNVLKSSQNCEFWKDEEDDEDDAVSDSSSDLFELDNLSLFENNRFREELPVYGTTYFDKNCSLIR